MKVKLKIPSMEKMKDFLKRYQFVLALIAVGLVLMALPGADKNEEKAESIGITGLEENFSVEVLEEKIGNILSQVEGAGKVSVMLTVRSGMERVLATDLEVSEQDSSREKQEQIVVVSTKEGEEAVLIQQKYPTFQGALVVCQGGDDPTVQLQLIKAVSALTGLNSNRITVCKGS